MNHNTQPNSSIKHEVLVEAAEWLTRLKSNEFTEHDQIILNQWKMQSVMHQSAWQRAEMVLGTFNNVPSLLGRNTLSKVDNVGRRRAIKNLALVLMVTPTAYLAYQQLPYQHRPWKMWQGDLRTATGESQTHTLADGTQLVLNTNSAVNINFSATERRVTLLAGEVLFTSGKEATGKEGIDNYPSSTELAFKRPFIVNTPQGDMLALGTRFSVRQLNDVTNTVTQLAVFEGAVEIQPIGSPKRIIVQAGEQRLFSSTNIQPAQEVTEDIILWEKGMLLAKNMPLAELINELSRYRRGILRCDVSVANLIVSGAFQVDNVQASLDLLQKTLPIKMSSITPWWITVKAQ